MVKGFALRVPALPVCEPAGEVGFLGLPVTDGVNWCLRGWSWWLSRLVTHRAAAHLEQSMCVSEISVLQIVY